MAFTVKDYWAYTTSNNTDKDFLMLLALPDGGGGYNLRNITKEDFLVIPDDMTLTFEQIAGSLITLDTTNSVTLNYVAAAQLVYFENLLNLGLSQSGNNNEVGLILQGGKGILSAGRSTGVIGVLRLYSTGGDLMDLESEMTSDESVRIKDGRKSSLPEYSLMFREDNVYERSTATNGGTTDIGNGERTLVVSQADGGSIASHTFNMPANPSSGDIVRLQCQGTFTSITINTPGAETVQSPLSSASSFTVREWVYDALLTEWLRTI